RMSSALAKPARSRTLPVAGSTISVDSAEPARQPLRKIFSDHIAESKSAMRPPFQVAKTVHECGFSSARGCVKNPWEGSSSVSRHAASELPLVDSADNTASQVEVRHICDELRGVNL